MSSAPWKVIPWKLIVILLQAYSYLNFNYNTAQNEFYMFQSSITWFPMLSFVCCPRLQFCFGSKNAAGVQIQLEQVKIFS